MQLPCFLAVVDEVPAIAEHLVVCLGKPAHIPPLPEGQLLVVDRTSEAALELLAQIDPRTMTGGLVVVTTREEHARDPRNVLRAQKLLAYLFMKFVVIPLWTTRIPDPLELRPTDTPPEYLHMLNRYRNVPLLLQHCLTDKLRHTVVGMPCLLLLPGPSLQHLKKHLPELARRYLIVTISRALPLLRECGVAPDVLMQLDTVPLQEHFHHPEESYPNSVLLALSLAPIRSFAPNFRHLFFIDSFDINILPNPSRIRESWLSSLLACLGAAEALHAPRVLLAGADLRVYGEDIYEGTQQEDANATRHDGPMTSQDSLVFLADSQGRPAKTTLQFFATAAETEMFAREIRTSMGASFHNLTPGSLLDPEICAPMSMEQALEAPVLDKTPFLDKADQAAAVREPIDLAALRALYSKEQAEARQRLDILTCLRCGAPEQVPTREYSRYVAANLPWFRPAKPDNLGRLAENLAHEMFYATRFARNVTALHYRAAKGMTIPVLCRAEEEEETVARLSRLRPGWTWRCLGIQAHNTGRGHPSAGALDMAVLHDWMRAQDVLIVAPGCAREFHYILSIIRGDNVVDLEELLGDSPLR